MTLVKQIQDAVAGKKAVIGVRSAIGEAKRGQVGTIIHASNLPVRLQQDLARCAAAGIEVTPFGEDSQRLGQVCGKPFRILAIGIRK